MKVETAFPLGMCAGLVLALIVSIIEPRQQPETTVDDKFNYPGVIINDIEFENELLQRKQAVQEERNNAQNELVTILKQRIATLEEQCHE